MMDSFGHKNIFISRLASVKIWLDWKLEVYRFDVEYLEKKNRARTACRSELL